MQLILNLCRLITVNKEFARPAYDDDPIFDGHPSERASLVPDESSGRTAVWKFEAFATRRIWLVCTYGRADRAVVLELPAAFRRCVADFGKGVPVAVGRE